MPRGHLVSDWMTPNVVSIGPTQPVLEAVYLLKKNRIRTLPVTSGTLLLGVISDRDVRNPIQSLRDMKLADLYKSASDIQVEHIMSSNLITVTPNDHIATASHLIISKKISALPVIEKKGSNHIVGIITTTDLLKAFLQLMDISNI